MNSIRKVLRNPLMGGALISLLTLGALVGVMREWGDLETGRVAAWIFLGGLAALAAAILVLYRTMESRLG